MERRSFLKWATHGLGALFGVVLGVPAVAYLIDARNRAARSRDFKPVAKLSELEVDVPKQVAIHDIRRDAWTLHPNDVIGRVWLIRREGGTVDAYTTICPHLGCSINYEDKNQLFICPCHGGTFKLTGERVSDQDLGHSNPVPRNMDKLESRERDAAGEKIIEVKYQNFRQLLSEQEAVT